MRITKADAEQLATRAAGIEASRSGDPVQLPSLEARALQVVESLFGALSDPDPRSPHIGLGEWRHRSEAAELLRDSGQLGINRQQLIGSVEAYNAIPWLKDPMLDWLAADSLMYAETIATFDSLSAQSMGIFGFAASRSRRVSLRMVAVGWAAIKWIAWVGIGWILYTKTAWAGMVWVALTALRIADRRRRLGPLRRVTPELFRAYQSLASGNVSWELVWEELRRTRELGAVWDPALYRLVETRRSVGAKPAF